MTTRTPFQERMQTMVDELKQKGVDQVQIAAAAGVTKGTVTQWLDGGIKSIKMENALGLEDAFGYSHVWLVLGRNGKMAADRKEGFARDLAREPIRHVRFKITGGVSGFTVDYLEDDDHEPLFFKRSWYERRGYVPERLYAMTVRGESMLPSLSEGDIVVVNTGDTALADGCVYAINYHGEVVVKRIIRDMGRWWLVSDNPDQHRYVRVMCDENTFIIGRIVHSQTEHV